MKFGRNLPRNQVPEWDTAYINYKSLKKLIKTITDEAKHADADVAGADTAGTAALQSLALGGIS